MLVSCVHNQAEQGKCILGLSWISVFLYDTGNFHPHNHDNPQRHAPRPISQVMLDSVGWPVNISHHDTHRLKPLMNMNESREVCNN